MKRVATFLALPFFLTTLFLAAPAQAETPAAAIVQKFYDALQTTMQEGPELGFEGRYKKLEPAVSATFNLPLMARYAVGAAWVKASHEEQEKLVGSFSAFSIATYASRFTKYDGEVFKVGGEKPAAGGGIMVETTLTPKGSTPVILNYLLRPDEAGALRIVDVYLDASISELATRRADFTSIIKREGMPTLLRSLDEKTEKMRQSKKI